MESDLDINLKKMNLLIKSQPAIYHLINLTILLRIGYERLLLCLMKLFNSTDGKSFEKKKKNLIKKLIDYQDFQKLVESINVTNIKKIGIISFIIMEFIFKNLSAIQIKKINLMLINT